MPDEIEKTKGPSLYSRLDAWANNLTRINVSQKLFFVQQLGIMVRTGISLAVALKTLTEQTTNKRFRIILTDISADVQQGNLLSKGLERYPKVFSELFVSMVRAGEASGKLENVLQQLYQQMKKDHAIVSKVRGAMIYPSVVLVAMLGIGILMVIYVIPQLTAIFQQSNITLPWTTRILIGISDVMTKHGILLAIAAVLGVIAFRWVTHWPPGRRRWHGLLLRAPVAGLIIRKINIARFCRTLTSLLKTDIAIIKSMEITSQVLGNTVYRDALLASRDKIQKGVTIAESLRPYPNIFPPVILQMIAVGEETGALDVILEESASFYEEDVDQTMTTLPTLIEPILITLLGVGVAGMAVAVIMPIYSLTQAI